MNIKWVHEAKLYSGDYCTAQGMSHRCLPIHCSEPSVTFRRHTATRRDRRGDGYFRTYTIYIFESEQPFDPPLGGQAISVHTFIAVMWRKGTHSRLAAFCIVGFIWLFVVLFVGLGVGLHRSPGDLYDVPTPVRPVLTPCFCSPTRWILHSFGVGSEAVSWRSASRASISGSGSPCPRLCSSTSRSISGAREGSPWTPTNGGASACTGQW